MKDYSVLDGIKYNQECEIQTAFDKGYKQGYEEGMQKNLTQARIKGAQDGKEYGREEAWEAARTYYNYWKNCYRDPNKFASELEIDAKLGQDVIDIVLKMSPDEAINVLKKYKDKIKCNNDFKVGDEVYTSKDAKGAYLDVGMVLCPRYQGSDSKMMVVSKGGSVYGAFDKSCWHKTGKNLPLEDVLRKIGES